MTGIQAANQVVCEKQVHLMRPRKGEPGQYDVKPYCEGSKRGWFYLDLFTASYITAVYNALNESNKAKFAAMPIQKMASVAFKVA